MLTNSHDLKIILVFLLKGLLMVVVLSLVSQADYGLYSFLIAVAMGATRILDFGTSEGIVVDDISDSFRLKIYEILKLKFISYFFIFCIVILINLSPMFEVPFVGLFFASFMIIFIREYSFSALLTIKEKNDNDVIARPNLGILLPSLQIIFCLAIYSLFGHLIIEHLLFCSLLALLISSFFLFRNDIFSCIAAKLSIRNSIYLFRENYQRYKYQITISWISAINKLFESNIIFFVIGAQQFASFAVYQIGFGACSFFIKYFRVRSVAIILSYKRQIIKFKYIAIIFVLFCFLIFSGIYFGLIKTISSSELSWFIKDFILVCFLVPFVLVSMTVDWVFVVILRNSKQAKYEVNKTIFVIFWSYLATFLLSYLAFKGLQGPFLLYFVGAKDMAIAFFSSIYIMNKVKSIE